MSLHDPYHLINDHNPYYFADHQQDDLMTTDREDEQKRSTSPNHLAMSNQKQTKNADYQLKPESKIMGNVTGKCSEFIPVARQV